MFSPGTVWSVLCGFLLVVWTASVASAQDPMLYDELHHMLPADNHDTWTLALGDVDGDGDLDLICCGRVEQACLYLNDGDGFYADAQDKLPQAALDPRCASLGDVDGDGDLDLMIGISGAQNLLYLNDGTGTFSDASGQLPSGTDSTWDIEFGDLDGDGDIDAFLGNRGQDRLFLNDGTGTFSDAIHQIPSYSSHTYAVALGDVDGDLDLDVMLGDDQHTRLYLNDGAGFFLDASSRIPADDDETRALVLGDVDGDSDLDVLLGNTYTYGSSCQTCLYLNDGTGTFSDATTQLPIDDDCTHALALIDVDGDADLDLFVGNYHDFEERSSRDRLYLNDGAGRFSDPGNLLFRDDDWTRAVVVGDVDADGDVDVVTGNDGQNRLLLNDGTDRLEEVTSPVPPEGYDTRTVALGDVDADGDLDLYVGQSEDGSLQNRLLLNDGTGIFSDAASQLPQSDDETNAVALGDLDGDGDLDVFVGNDGRNALHLNDGAGSFVDLSCQIPGYLDDTLALALGDVDGDGDLDVLLGNQVCNRLYLNDGSARFYDATCHIIPTSGGARSVALGDVDGDRDLDLITGKYWQNQLYLNNGCGVFLEATAQLPNDSDDTRAVTFGDVDDDGDLDIFVGNDSYGGTQNRLYLNGGKGIFSDNSGNLPPDDSQSRAVALQDVDADGDLDVIVGNAGYQSSARNQLLLNDGNGVFFDATQLLPPHQGTTNALALGDLDHDGDLDLVSGETGQNRVYVNLGRQLAWRALPRPGRRLTMEIYGPAGGYWRVAASRRHVCSPQPPTGTLRIDPRYIMRQQRGFLDKNGRATVSFEVPNSPVLIAASLYWQAVVGDNDPRLSNLEVATFSRL